jgi:hypothetical protein
MDCSCGLPEDTRTQCRYTRSDPLMLPLISESTFEALKQRRATIAGESAHVFVPVADDEPQLLFIGQATRGEMGDGSYKAASEKSYAILQRGYANPPCGFWQAVVAITNKCARITSEDTKLLRIGWSNLCKIGDCKHNPSRKSICAQADMCVQALREELPTAKPVVTILLSGDLAVDEILYPAFGKNGWGNNVPDENETANRMGTH